MTHPFDGPTAFDVLRQQAEGNRLMTAVARAIAPHVNAALDMMADRMIANMQKSLEDWCPGCGERALLSPDLCQECAGLNVAAENAAGKR